MRISAGVAILWARGAGSLMTWTLNEGLACFLVWSFFVGGALVTACGVATASITPHGVMFMLLLVLTLLILNSQARWVSERFRNGWVGRVSSRN
jgi:hypothetical protein